MSDDPAQGAKGQGTDVGCLAMCCAALKGPLIEKPTIPGGLQHPPALLGSPPRLVVPRSSAVMTYILPLALATRYFGPQCGPQFG